MKRRLLTCVAAAVAVGISASACSDSTTDDPPGIDRIDGPAQVDPSFDPTQGIPASVPPTETDG